MISRDELVKWLNEKIKIIDEHTKIERDEEILGYLLDRRSTFKEILEFVQSKKDYEVTFYKTVLKDIENFLKQYKISKIDTEEVKNEDS